MTSTFIYDAVRTPFGRAAGALSGIRPDDLAAVVMKAAVERTGVDPARIEDVIFGDANQAGEDNRNVARFGALLAGFPHGTVTGAPKVRAMEIINEVEPHKRGLYAGGVGYIGAGGDMDTCIALRTGIVKDGMLHVQAGGGVVLDSDPEAELQETLHKSRALFRAASEAWRYP